MRTFARDPPWLLQQRPVHLDALPSLTPTSSSLSHFPTCHLQLRKGTITVQDAVDTIMKFPSVVQFCSKWAEDEEPQAICANHARRYVLALRPDSGVAFHETDRYKNPRNALRPAGQVKGRRPTAAVAAATAAKKDADDLIEVGVFATRAFKKGEIINLRGGVADLTEEEDDNLRGNNGGRSEFSILWSERKSCFCLLLGPARFCNHDCRNNVEFQLVGANMSFRVVEDIAKDEELFTHYGDHYFERDNATCLCATCEQHSKGAFTPKQPAKKAAAVAAPASPSAPSRRSGRATAAVNYDESGDAPVASTSSGTGHALTAQRSVRSGLSRSTSLSSLSSSRTDSPRRPAGSRANPSRISVSEALRLVPRTVVQPKLPPPFGYKADYVWDSRKKAARYVGPQVCKVDEAARKPAASSNSGSMKRSASAPSVVSLGKRRRGASDSPAPSPRGRTRSSAAAAAAAAEGEPEASPRPKRVRSNLAKLPPVRLGERSSSRIVGGSRSARERTFAKLSKLLGKDEEDSELSDLEESEADEQEQDQQMQEQALEDELANLGEQEAEDSDSGKEAAEVEAMLSPAASVSAKRTTRPASPPLPFSLPGLNAASHSAPSALPTLASTSTRSTRSGTVTSSAPSRSLAVDVGPNSTSTPAEEAPSPQLRCESSASASEEADAEPEDKIVLCPVPLPSSTSSPPAKRPTRSIGTSGFYSPATAATVDSGGEGSSSSSSNTVNTAAPGQSFRRAPSGEGGVKTTSSIGGGGGGGLGGGGGGDDERDGRDRKEVPVDKMDVDGGEEQDKSKEGTEGEEEMKPAVAGKGGEAPALEEQVADDPEDAAAALLMLLSAPLSTTSIRPPPQTDSSAASTSTEASTSASTATTAATEPFDAPVDKKGKRKRVSDEYEPSPPPQSHNPRSTRRQPNLKMPEPEAWTLVTKSKKKARLSESPAPAPAPPAASTSRRRASVVSAKQASPETPSTAEARRTRSKPLPGKLEDVLYGPETLKALGGYDYEKGRYISKHEALRDPSNDPRPPPRPSPSPPPAAARATPASKPHPASLKTASSAPAKRSRLSHSPASSSRSPAVAALASRRGSLPGSSSLKPTVAPPEGVRSTRRSYPIAQPLRDLIYSPAVLAANGGWDAEKGAYVSASSAASTGSPIAAPPARRTSSASAAPLSTSHRRTASTSPALANPRASTSGASSAPPDGTRSTRRSFPMAQMSVQDLVYGEAARSVSGGWDEEAGRYVSAAKAAQATGTGGRA
ncbi:hypothetical protein JCM8097_007049 [Rhodosporidiobolus ruineniae]